MEKWILTQFNFLNSYVLLAHSCSVAGIHCNALYGAEYNHTGVVRKILCACVYAFI